MNTRFKKNMLILFLMLGLAVFLAIANGSVKIPISEIGLAKNQPILYLRFLRIIVAVVAGSGLAVSGIALQAILKNPLAEPYLLGTSSGAGLAAVIAIIAGVSRLYLPFAAFIGALLAILLVYNLASENNRVSGQSLILTGVIVSVALSAIIIFLISVSKTEVIHAVTWWMWGSLQVYDAALLLSVSAITLAGIITIYIFSQDLNAMSISDEEAQHLGIDVETVKKILIVATSLVTAGIVCLCGVIGFVGLIVPHTMRFIAGPNHKTLIPLTCVAASSFMVLCDTLSRTVCSPLEIPIGVITAVLGTPVFMYLLKREQKVK
jgi:iron complex transport system permease protein